MFDVFGRPSAGHADPVNREALEELAALLDDDLLGPGRCVLLRAPRAGFGKTHLLNQVEKRLSGSHEFILLTLADGSRIHPGSVLEDMLRRLCRPLPAGSGLTMLDLIARRVLAMGLVPLVRSGEVPCQDRDGALHALEHRATETFDFHHPNAVTAHWTRENFALLGPRLGLELCEACGGPLREAIGWVDALFRFAAAPVDQPARIGNLIEWSSSAVSMDRLACLLRLLAPLHRMVLVADEIEGLSSDPDAGLRLAAFVTSLRQTADRADVIIAINDDLWLSAFRPRLSGGLEDRLAEHVVNLRPLTESQIVSLLDAYYPGEGATLARALGLSEVERYARRVIRRAAEVREALRRGERIPDLESLIVPPSAVAAAPALAAGVPAVTGVSVPVATDDARRAAATAGPPAEQVAPAAQVAEPWAFPHEPAEAAPTEPEPIAPWAETLPGQAGIAETEAPAVPPARDESRRIVDAAAELPDFEAVDSGFGFVHEAEETAAQAPPSAGEPAAQEPAPEIAPEPEPEPAPEIAESPFVAVHDDSEALVEPPSVAPATAPVQSAAIPPPLPPAASPREEETAIFSKVTDGPVWEGDDAPDKDLSATGPVGGLDPVAAPAAPAAVEAAPGLAAEAEALPWNPPPAPPPAFAAPAATASAASLGVATPERAEMVAAESTPPPAGVAEPLSPTPPSSSGSQFAAEESSTIPWPLRPPAETPATPSVAVAEPSEPSTPAVPAAPAPPVAAADEASPPQQLPPEPAVPVQVPPPFGPGDDFAPKRAPAPSPDAERIDELLRQFRERYGRR